MTTNQQEYIRLCILGQEKIREGMGEPRRGDVCFHEEWGFGMFFDGFWKFQNGNNVNPQSVMDSYCVRLPQVHDLNDEKRGLWGMVDWNRWRCESRSYAQVLIYSINGYDYPDCEGTLTDALLSALCKQWGVEVEG